MTLHPWKYNMICIVPRTGYLYNIGMYTRYPNNGNRTVEEGGDSMDYISLGNSEVKPRLTPVRATWLIRSTVQLMCFRFIRGRILAGVLSISRKLSILFLVLLAHCPALFSS